MSVQALSPLDGRYSRQTAELGRYFSEGALIRHRVLVEVEWLILMSERPEFPEVRPFTEEEISTLRSWVAGFADAEAERVKEIERTTRHDVKAVEYYLKERLAGTSLEGCREFVHFACTSEDINNLAYGRMLKHGLRDVWLPLARRLAREVAALSDATRDMPMLARTHGQPATPTTLGKELAVFAYRWGRQLQQFERLEFLGKFNGAVGTFSAHTAAYPRAPWEEIGRAMVERVGLTYNPLTTQIEPHDCIAEAFHLLMRFNTVLLDFDRDAWSYISLGYFRQKVIATEAGSSVMPHKVNPIDFENSEANAGVANALLDHLAGKLPISRLQRDLTDSSAIRNMGVAVGHAVIALKSALTGLSRLEVDREAMARDLEDAWEVLAEAVQTVMRKHGIDNPYERLKAMTRGTAITREEMHALIRSLDLPLDDKERLLALTPTTYTGLAARLVDHVNEPCGDTDETH